MGTRPATFDHLKSSKKPLERIVQIFLDDETVEAVDKAQTAVFNAGKDAKKLKQAEDELAVRQAELAEQTVTLLFRSVGRKRYDEILQAHPPTPEAIKDWTDAGNEGKPVYDVETFSVGIIAASCVDPVMSEAQVAELRDGWNTAEYSELFTAALQVNTQRRVADLGNFSG